MSGPEASPIPRRRPAAVIFDLDGTLVDSFGAITESLNHARAGFGLEPLDDARVRRSVGRGLEALVADLVGPDQVAGAVRLFRERYAEVYASGTRVIPGVRESLEALGSAGIRMAVASNKPARFGRPILESLELATFFDAIHGPDTTGATKPEPTMLRRCLEAAGVAAGDAVYVGDMALDVESADRAGVDVVLVATGAVTVDELRETGRPVYRDLVAWSHEALGLSDEREVHR